jgi:hypothetical protein
MRVDVDPLGQWWWVQFALPCKISDLPSGEELPPPSLNKELTPWMERWIGRGPDEIRRSLSMEWAGIRESSVARFRDVILKYRPFALAHDGTRWYLGLNRGHEEGFDVDDAVYIESPLEPAVLEKCLADHGLDGSPVIREFYKHFNGLRDEPIHAGNFERPEEWRPFRALGWDEDGFPEEHRSTAIEWFDALIIYTTACGDMVLRNADDETAWLLHEEYRVTPLASSFSAFLDLCAESYDERSWLEYD